MFLSPCKILAVVRPCILHMIFLFMLQGYGQSMIMTARITVYTYRTLSVIPTKRLAPPFSAVSCVELHSAQPHCRQRRDPQSVESMQCHVHKQRCYVTYK